MTDPQAFVAAVQRMGQARAPLAIAALLHTEPARTEMLTAQTGPLLLDQAKEQIGAAEWRSLLQAAAATDLRDARARLFAGEAVNATEGRPALHMALRAAQPDRYRAAGAAVGPAILAARARMRDFAEAVRSGAWRGATGAPIRAIVHLGIGGSDLGPRLAHEALARVDDQAIALRFAANIDPADFALAIAGLDPRETLVIAVSKTFTTLETLANLDLARRWLRAGLGDAGDRHLAAVSAAPDKCAALGVDPALVFPFWDWVGGRYSLWSAVSLSLMIALGPEVIARLHRGAESMDQHFETAPIADNLPIRAAVLDVWRRNGLGIASRCVAPYARRLRLLPAFLQQLEMESNGKATDRAGALLDYPTAPVTWGAEATNAQHAFFQSLHQNREDVAVEIVAVAQAGGDRAMQTDLLANALAQAQGLTQGWTIDQARADLVQRGLEAAAIDAQSAHWVCRGNRPNSFVLLRDLSPESLGALLAFYEHRTFAAGWLWGVNPFDQFGVELGKRLARNLRGDVDAASGAGQDSSTAGLLRAIADWRG